MFRTGGSVVALLFVISTCGHAAPTAKEADAALDLARAGKSEELRALLAKKPALANAPVAGDMALLEMVVDIRPIHPNMMATLEVLVESGADPNRNAPEILRKAIWHGDPDIFEFLLDNGADPTIRSERKKMTMLEYARSSEDERFAEICDE